jgi:dsRNA-specific ribonuclease
MDDYSQISEALVSEGYLSDADVDAAIVVLTDALTIAEVEEIEAESIIDLAAEKELIDEAEHLAAEAEALGDQETEEIAEDAIEEALGTVALDVEVIETAEAIIDVAVLNATAALVAAQLIDEANAEAVAAVIAGVKEGK